MRGEGAVLRGGDEACRGLIGRGGAGTARRCAPPLFVASHWLPANVPGTALPRLPRVIARASAVFVIVRSTGLVGFGFVGDALVLTGGHADLARTLAWWDLLLWSPFSLLWGGCWATAGWRPGRGCPAPRDAGGQSRGSTGSDSRASTANTHSCTRHSGSSRATRSSASRPSAYSRIASERFAPRARLRRRSRFSGSV